MVPLVLSEAKRCLSSISGGCLVAGLVESQHVRLDVVVWLPAKGCACLRPPGAMLLVMLKETDHVNEREGMP
jgi:hypothetical protein